MTIAIIGTGNIGGTLGRAFARAGLDVVFGAREPATSKAAGDTAAKVVGVAEAVRGGEAVLLAIPAGQVRGFVAAHTADLDGKLIVDATNNFPGPVFNAAEAITELLPNARYARAFNSQPWEAYEKPTWNGVQGDLFFTSEEEDRATLEELITAVGLRPAYLGAREEELLDAALRLLRPTFARSRHVGLRILTDED
jgi:8-hydroxy-5-deazaflavin:NADPH oxidoreductase